MHVFVVFLLSLLPRLSLAEFVAVVAENFVKQIRGAAASFLVH